MNKTRLVLTGALGLVIVVAAGFFVVGIRPSLETSEPTKPNIVLIIIDTLRADKLSAYGYPSRTTPELDELADRGVRFARVIAQSPWTRPSIGSMLTSLYPRSIGIYEKDLQALGDQFETLAEVLQRSGYTTFGATANPNINSSFQFDQGFDHYSDSDILWEWMRPEPAKTSTRERPLPTSREILDGVLAWVGKNGKPPYYVQVNLMEVHQARTKEVLDQMGDTLFAQEPSAPYLRALHHVSGEIGRFVRLASERVGWGNTLFVITSDHGQGLTDHPDVPASQGHGNLLYESQILVPLILYNPARDPAGGRVVEERVRLLDLMPTLLEYAGVPAPGGMQGISVLPMVRPNGGRVSLPEHFIVETDYQAAEKIGVYTSVWKYIENRDGHRGTNPQELQRIGVKENGQKTDVARQFPQVVQELQRVLREWERAHPKIPPSVPGQGLSPAEVEQLRALGYVNQPEVPYQGGDKPP